MTNRERCALMFLWTVLAIGATIGGIYVEPFMPL